MLNPHCLLCLVFLRIPPQFDILNCDNSIYPPLLRFAEEESEAKLNKVILVSWKSYSQSLPLLLSQTNSSIEAFPIQTGAPHTNISFKWKYKNISTEIPKYFNRNTKIL